MHRIKYDQYTKLEKYARSVNNRGQSAVARYLLYMGYEVDDIAKTVRFDKERTVQLLDEWREYYIALNEQGELTVFCNDRVTSVLT